MVTSNLSAHINDVLRYVGITRNMNAYIILSQALTMIAEDEDRLRAVEKEIYTPIADKKLYESKAVQSTIRRASKVAWDLCPDRVQELAGYPLNGRPSAVTMLELLYNGVARYDDLSILKYAFLALPATAATIAVAHSLFNIVCTAILMPASGLLEKLSIAVVPDKTAKESRMRRSRISTSF